MLLPTFITPLMLYDRLLCESLLRLPLYLFFFFFLLNDRGVGAFASVLIARGIVFNGRDKFDRFRSGRERERGKGGGTK